MPACQYCEVRGHILFPKAFPVIIEIPVGMKKTIVAGTDGFGIPSLVLVAPLGMSPFFLKAQHVVHVGIQGFQNGSFVPGVFALKSY